MSTEQRLKRAQALAHLGSWELNLRTGEVIWSEEMYRLHNLPIGTPPLSLHEYVQLVHPEDRPAFVDHSSHLREGNLEFRLLFPNGDVRYIRATIEQLCDEQKVPLLTRGTSMDISAQKQAEIAMKQALAFNVGILNGTDYAIIATNPIGVITAFNRGAERMLGYSASEVVYQVTPGIFHEVSEVIAYAETLSEELGEVIDPGFEVFVAKARKDITDEKEWTYKRKNGTRVTVLLSVSAMRDEAGNIIGFLGIANDISARKAQEEALRRSEERLNDAQRTARMGSWEFDVATGSIHWSAELFRLVDRDPDLGEPTYAEQLALYEPEYAERLDAYVIRALSEGTAYELDLQRVDAIGEVRWFHAAGTPFWDQEGVVVRLAGTLQDITQQKMLEAQMEHQIALISEQSVQLEMQAFELEEANRRLEALAITDGLTKLYNHRAFQEKLAEEWKRTGRYYPPLSIILLDVDKFKLYNDAYGHPEGDIVLKTVAKLLQQTARNTDYVCRYGGEEFVIILTETGSEEACRAAERFRKAIESYEWRLRPVTASFGVATLNALHETHQQLVSDADRALYASKHAGRNRVTHVTALEPMESNTIAS